MSVEVSRRQILAGTVAAGFAASPLGAVARPWGAPAVFLYDGRFAESFAHAQTWAGHGVRLIDARTHDLGHVWRIDLPAPLVSGRWVAGATLFSDRLISEQFGREHGLRPRSAVALNEGLVLWALA